MSPMTFKVLPGMKPGSSSVARKRRGSRYWVGKMSLDFRKWCQHFGEYTYTPVGEVLDEAFGIPLTYANVQSKFGFCVVYRCQRRAPPEELCFSDEELKLSDRERVLAARAGPASYFEVLNNGGDVDEGIAQKQRHAGGTVRPARGCSIKKNVSHVRTYKKMAR